jgi:hypothetical protein
MQRTAASAEDRQTEEQHPWTSIHEAAEKIDNKRRSEGIQT